MLNAQTNNESSATTDEHLDNETSENRNYRENTRQTTNINTWKHMDIAIESWISNRRRQVCVYIALVVAVVMVIAIFTTVSLVASIAVVNIIMPYHYYWSKASSSYKGH